MGDKKYGNDWITRDLDKDIEEELLDISNYAYLMYRKLKLIKKHH